MEIMQLKQERQKNMDMEQALYIVNALAEGIEKKPFVKIENCGMTFVLQNDGKHVVLQVMNDGLAACLRVDNFSKHNLACLVCKVVNA